MNTIIKLDKDYIFYFNVLLLGNSCVRKSSLFLRFCDDIWNALYIPTNGFDCRIKTFDIDEKK